MLAAMNALPYACGTLGNHEFNYGLDFLDNGLAKAEFPLVCANVERVGGHAADRPLAAVRAELRGRGRQTACPQDRRDRLRAAADHAMGQGQSRRQAHRHRHRRRRPPASARAAEDRRPTSSSRSAIPASPAASARAWRRTRRCTSPRLDGIDVILTGHQHLVFPGGKAFDGIAGVDNVKGSLQRQAGLPARLLGLASRHRRSRAGEARRALARRRLQGRAAADLRAHARPQDRSQGRRRASRARRPSRPTTRRRWSICASRSARPPRRSTASSRWSPTTLRCRSSPRRRSPMARG